MLGSLSKPARIALLAVALPAASPAPHWFSTRGDPLFADARAQIQVLVDADGRHVANRFRVVGERIDGDSQACVHWITEDRPILWEPQTDNPRAIAGSRRNLDLKRDVVAGNDVGGGTYRLTRATADRILLACRRTGTRYLVTGAAPAHG